MAYIQRVVTVSLLVLVCAALVGCATTSRQSARSAAFAPADLDRAALVLTTGVGADMGFFRFAGNEERAEALRERVSTHFPVLASHFGTTIEAPSFEALEEAEWEGALQAYDRVLEETKYLVWRRRPLEVAVPPELTRLAAEADTRYLVFLRSVGWRMTSEARVAEALFNVALAVTTGMMTYRQRSAVGVELMVIDGATSRVVWFSQHNTELDPERTEHLDAALAALAYELHTGRRISAHSFLPWAASSHVNVWLAEGGRVTGRFEAFEGMQVVLRQRDGTRTTIPLDRVRRVSDVYTGQYIFPAASSSSGPVTRLF